MTRGFPAVTLASGFPPRRRKPRMSRSCSRSMERRCVVNASVRSGAFGVRRGLSLAAIARDSRLLSVLLLVSCKWFTDFKEQPKIDPWDLRPDSSASRGNPQSSVSLYGTMAPDFVYGRTSLDIDKMSGLVNPIAA